MLVPQSAHLYGSVTKHKVCPEQEYLRLPSSKYHILSSLTRGTQVGIHRGFACGCEREIGDRYRSHPQLFQHRIGDLEEKDTRELSSATRGAKSQEMLPCYDYVYAYNALSVMQFATQSSDTLDTTSLLSD